MAHNWFYMGRF